MSLMSLGSGGVKTIVAPFIGMSPYCLLPTAIPILTLPSLLVADQYTGRLPTVKLLKSGALGVTDRGLTIRYIYNGFNWSVPCRYIFCLVKPKKQLILSQKVGKSRWSSCSRHDIPRALYFVLGSIFRPPRRHVPRPDTPGHGSKEVWWVNTNRIDIMRTTG